MATWVSTTITVLLVMGILVLLISMFNVFPRTKPQIMRTELENLVVNFCKDGRAGFLPLVEHLEKRMEPFPLTSCGGHFAGIHIEDDCYGYEIKLGMSMIS